MMSKTRLKDRFGRTTATALPLVAILLAALLALPFACGKKEAGEIKVGVILPLTGPIAMGGQRVLHGIELAVEEFNSTHSTRVVLVTEDSQAQPQSAVNAINKLIRVHDIRAIIGDLTSGATLAMAPIAEQNKVVVLAPGASSPDVRNAGDFIFRNWTSDDFDGKVAASYLYKQLSKSKVVVLYILNDYGLGLKDAFAGEFASLGGEVVYSESFEQGQNDFRTLLAKIKQHSFDAIYIAGQPKEMGFLIKQMAELGITSTLFSNASVEEKEFQTIAAGVSTEIYYTSPAFNLESDDSLIVSFVNSYKKKFQEDPDIASAHGFDAARMLFGCLQGDAIDPVELKTCLYSLREFPGVTGSITMDSNGDAVKSLLVKRLRASDDQVEILEAYHP